MVAAEEASGDAKVVTAKEEEVATKARAVEAVRREHAVLEGKLGKLEGKLQAAATPCESTRSASQER